MNVWLECISWFTRTEGRLNGILRLESRLGQLRRGNVVQVSYLT